MPILMPNQPYPATVDLDLARLCARLVVQAYEMFDRWDKKRPAKDAFVWPPPEPPVPGLIYHDPIWATYRYAQRIPPRHAHESGSVRWVDKPCPVGFVASHQNRIFVVFRGTQTDYEWMKVNFKFLHKDCEFDRFGEGKAHAGFLSYYETARNDLLPCLAALDLAGKEVVLTGHSLGGALATLAAHDLADEPVAAAHHLYTFGAPRVLNPKLARYFEGLPVSAFRVVNVEDAVTTVPIPAFGKLTYQHVGTPICFSAHYGEAGANHDMKNYLYALENPDQPQRGMG